MSDSHNIPPVDPPDKPHLRLVGDDVPPSPSDTITPAHDNGSHQRLLHELGNLLDGSLRNVGLALSRLDDQADDAPVDPAARDCLRTADLSLQHMAGLLRQWMRNGCADLAATYRHDATLEEITQHAVRVTQPVARVQEIDLIVEMEPATLAFPASQLYPVIINGLRNAVEAVGRNGRVIMQTLSQGDDIEIRITDNGPGISPQLPRDKDGLVAPGVTTKSNGQGLGLVISRDLVRALGGVIRLEPADAGGTVLLIRLPMTS